MTDRPAPSNSPPRTPRTGRHRLQSPVAGGERERKMFVGEFDCCAVDKKGRTNEMNDCDG